MGRKHRISDKQPHIKKLKHLHEGGRTGSGRWACHGPWIWAYGETSQQAYDNFQAALERARCDRGWIS